MSLSDDGRDLITMNGDGSLACRDGVRGTLRSKLPLPDHCRGTLSLWTEIAGFGGPGIVYVALLDLTDRTSRLIEWDTRAGTTRDIISELAFQWTMGTGQPMPEVRSYAVLAGDGPRFVSTPGFHEAQERGVELRAYDPRGVLVWHAEASPSVWQMPQPLASTRDGTRGFLSCSYHGIWGVNLKTGEPMGLIPPPEITEGGWDVIAPGPDGRYLFWPTVSSGHILIRDTAIKAWVAPLSHRLLGRAVPRVSPDGRWLAVAGSSPSSAAASTFVSHLLLYDISGLSSRSEDDP
jgi:hypothetical protein